MPNQDWFENNAPTGGDWFDQNANAPKPPSLLDKIGSNAEDFLGDLTSAARSVIPGTPEAQKAGEQIFWSLRHPGLAFNAHEDATKALVKEGNTQLQQPGLLNKIAGESKRLAGGLNQVMPGVGTGIGGAMNSFGQGDIGHGLAQTALTAAPALLPEMGGAAANATDSVLQRGAAYLADKKASMARGAANAADRASTDFTAANLFTRALKPVQSDPNWKSEVINAARNVKTMEAQRGYPIGEVPKTGNPLDPRRAPEWYMLDDARDATEQWQQQQLQKFDDNYLNPAIASGTKVSGNPIYNNVLMRVTGNGSMEKPELSSLAANFPGKAQATLNRASSLYANKAFGAKDFQQQLANVNALLKTEYSKSEGVTAANVRTHPNTAGYFAEAQALRDGFYDLLGKNAGEADGSTPRSMMRDYGQSMSLMDAILQQQNPTLASDPHKWLSSLPMLGRALAQFNMGEMRGASSNASTSMVRMFSPSTDAGNLVRKAFAKVKGQPDLPVMPEGGTPTPKLLGAAQIAPTVQQLGSDWSMPPGGPKIKVTGFTPQLEGQPQLALPPAKIPPQRQLPPSSGPSIPGRSFAMPGGQPPIVPPPPVFPQAQLPPDSSGIIPPQLPPGVQPGAPMGPPPGVPPAARGRTIAGIIPKPPAMPKPPKGPSAAERKLRTTQEFKGAKDRLDRTYAGMAKANKIASYGVPPGVLTDIQQGKYNQAVGQLQQQQQNALAAIPSDPQPPMMPGVPLPAAGGSPPIAGPAQVVVGENGPEKLVHADGRPPEQVGISGPEVLTLGQHGADQVVPERPFPDKGIIRGSSNIPLSAEGEQQAAALGAALKKAGGLDALHASDLARTQQTAQAISQATGAHLFPPNPGLRSWALGDLEGRPSTKETDQIIQDHTNAHVDQPLPGQGPVSVSPGESFNQFKGRVIPTIQQIQQQYLANPMQRIGVVTHNRDEKLIRGWLAAGGGNEIDKRVMEEKGTKPGGVVHLAPIGGKWVAQDFNPAKQQTTPGIYLIRHSPTDWQPTDGGNSAS